MTQLALLQDVVVTKKAKTVHDVGGIVVKLVRSDVRFGLAINANNATHIGAP